jgi:hypothetical protein
LARPERRASESDGLGAEAAARAARRAALKTYRKFSHASRHSRPGVRLARLPGVARLALIQHVQDVAEAVDERVQDSLPLLC